jgi:regulator of chromosome condensation
LHSWGCGSDGRLGHPEHGNARYLYKESQPKIIEFFSNKIVLDAFSSYKHMIALAKDKK